jgi:hypothetical protein
MKESSPVLSLDYKVLLSININETPNARDQDR